MCLAAQLCVGWRTGRGIAAVLVCYSSSGTAAGVSAGLDIVGVGVLSQRFRFGKRLSKCTGLFLPTASVSLAPAGRGTGGGFFARTAGHTWVHPSFMQSL